MTTKTIFIRRIHRVSQKPEKDTEGPFEFKWDTLPAMWEKVRKQHNVRKKRNVVAREENGGAVFFCEGSTYAIILMPVGSEMHRKHAPPSHFREGGPLEGGCDVSS